MAPEAICYILENILYKQNRELWRPTGEKNKIMQCNFSLVHFLRIRNPAAESGFEMRSDPDPVIKIWLNPDPDRVSKFGRYLITLTVYGGGGGNHTMSL